MDLRQSIVNRRSQTDGANVVPQASSKSNTAPSAAANSGNLHKTLLLCTSVIAVAIIVAALVGSWAFNRSSDKTDSQVGYTGIAADRYQAVFLTNGQVYFGKLSDSG